MKNCGYSRAVLAIPALVSAAALITASVLLSGCYTLKQGTVMLGYLGRAVPLEELAGQYAAEEDARTGESEKTRRFVELVQDIRCFAIEELGLKNSKNYTRYVKLDRDYLAAVVSASAADSFTPHEWHYPVAGTMPYKGFFNVEDARKERAKLEKRGLDVWIRGVDAFSTLGWFRDPLYSYMRDYPPHRLADLIIHEQFHATVFIKGQVQFNEELAEFIGGEGARLYMESRFGADSEEYRAMIAAEAENKAYVDFLRELSAELEAVYAGSADRNAKLREKERVINAAGERFDAEYSRRFSTGNYRGFSQLPVNNAYLELYRLYHEGGGYFQDLYQQSGKNLSAFIAAAKTVKKGTVSPKVQFAAALGLHTF
ncbi:MAG: aminopeptidase [Treponema sp.]|jgi:predicted aminopeptidase|nr:aminopeptidase [Treponema sp.]